MTLKCHLLEPDGFLLFLNLMVIVGLNGFIFTYPTQAQIELSHLQRSGLVKMDRWKSAGYHQPGLVGRSCPIFSGLDWYRHGSVAVSRISPVWVGGPQLSHLQRSGLVDMDNLKLTLTLTVSCMPHTPRRT